jgi:hypothetical protein
MTNHSDKQEEVLTEMSEKVNEIHFAIFGNKRAGVKGMAEIVTDHSKAINEYKKLKWIATGATLGGWAGLIAYIKNHFGV